MEDELLHVAVSCPASFTMVAPQELYPAGICETCQPPASVQTDGDSVALIAPAVVMERAPASCPLSRLGSCKAT
jgi:hypothetical protein